MKKLIVYILLTVPLSIISFDSNAQIKGDKAAPGTYQIIQVPKSGEVFTDELLYYIEASRHETKEVWLNITANTQVRVLPKSVISQSNFIPIAEEIIDIEKYEYMQNYVLESGNKYPTTNPKKKKK